MSSRRDFLKEISLLTAGSGLLNVLPASIAKAMAIDPAKGSTYLDAEHIVFLMQENRSFDHTYGTLQGVRGYNDPRAIRLPNRKPVWYQANGAGETYAPFRLDIKNTNATWMDSLPHGWTDQVDARNHGHYNRWLDTKHSHVEEYKQMPLTLGCYTREDIPFYYSLADAFTVCDHNFCSSLTGTTPNRLYFWTGTIRDTQEETSMARVWNGDADDKTLVSWTTFPERLEDHGVSWKIYQNEITINSGLKDEHDAWLGNFGDNAIEYFKQFNAHAKAGSLSGRDKILRDRAFVINSGDPDYRELTRLQYNDNGQSRELLVPKGDIFHQFREDVKSGKLPTVSWLVAPQQFSDHPSSAWFGAWYISEAMNILTANPETWKKTIFILTYDENDGYFDHLPPFVPPHPQRKNSGKVSKGIDPALEYVTENTKQSSEGKYARISPIGLGYRVPLVIASPWTRGGWVNSQVFDHTSSLMFLEKFLSHKTGKKITEANISSWRRAVCGDLTSAFRTYNGEQLKKPLFLDRNEFVESIHKARFKNFPSNFVKLTDEQSEQVINGSAKLVPEQEKGIRDANILPYELYADATVSNGQLRLKLKAGNLLFGERSAGAAFMVYSPADDENRRVHRDYALVAGDTLEDEWDLNEFENGEYRLHVHGPNGFFREFAGGASQPPLEVSIHYGPAGEVVIELENTSSSELEFVISDTSYKKINKKGKLKANGGEQVKFSLNDSFGWFDFVVQTPAHKGFAWRYAGKSETVKNGKTDPVMGGVL